MSNILPILQKIKGLFYKTPKEKYRTPLLIIMAKPINLSLRSESKTNNN